MIWVVFVLFVFFFFKAEVLKVLQSSETQPTGFARTHVHNTADVCETC